MFEDAIMKTNDEGTMLSMAQLGKVIETARDLKTMKQN